MTILQWPIEAAARLSCAMNRVAIALAAAIAALALSGSGSARNVSYRAWAATAIPQARLEIAGGRGPRVSALSSDGRVAVVGDPRGVYVFRTSFEGSWDSFSRPAARLRLPHTALVNITAMATSSDGTTVLVATGAVGNNPSAVHVFHVSSPRAWTSPATPTAKLTNAADPTGFGSGVALSSDGTTALAGDLGGADVFHVATAASWRDSSRPTATLVAEPVGAEAGGLSIAVALSADGTTALIGATSFDTFFGAAYVFRTAAADAWVSSTTPDAVLTDGSAGLFGDGFGGAVALSPDGMTALVGAPNLAFGPVGAAYFFHVRSPNAWTSTANPDAMAGQHGSRRSGKVLGWSVALSEEGTALVGGPSVLGKAGAADVFHIAGSDESWGVGTDSRARLTNAASPPGDPLRCIRRTVLRRHDRARFLGSSDLHLHAAVRLQGRNALLRPLPRRQGRTCSEEGYQVDSLPRGQGDSGQGLPGADQTGRLADAQTRRETREGRDDRPQGPLEGHAALPSYETGRPISRAISARAARRFSSGG